MGPRVVAKPHRQRMPCVLRARVKRTRRLHVIVAVVWMTRKLLSGALGHQSQEL